LRIVAPDKNIHLADMQCILAALDGMRHGEQRVAVLLDLRTLMAMTGILHRQLMQPEFMLHGRQFTRTGIDQGHPDKAFRPLHIVGDFIRLDISEFSAVLIGGAVGKHDAMIQAASAAKRHPGGFEVPGR
jgi:hypothetical protein